MFKTILSALLLAIYVQAFVTVNMQQLPNETIRIIVTNPNEKDVKLLKHPHSVLETELATAKFAFTSVDNSDLPTSKDSMILWGPKYTAKIDGTYVTIPAGGSIHFDHDLLKSYTFPKFDKTQRFTISLAQSSFVTPDRDIAFATPSLTITISGRHSNPFPSLLRPFLTTGAFDCTDDQRRALDDWAAWVKKWSSENSDYLNDKDEVYAKPTIYTYWFGDIDAGGGLYYLQTTFNRLKAVSLNTFACGECTGNGGLNDPYDVGIIDLGPTDTGDVSLFVCSTFWDLIRNGNDGEPIRRMAHAAVTSRRIAQAQEYAQGATDCHQLALDHPEKAIKNADSMARFILWNPV